MGNNTDFTKFIIQINDETPEWERVDEITARDSYDDVKRTINWLKKDLLSDSELVALCAPQIGVNLRLFCVRTASGIKEFLNPMIVSGEGMHLSRETNASFKGKQFIIPRKNKLHVAYQTADGHVSSETFIGAYAEVVQQMIEMLDGILIKDYGFDLDDVGGAKQFDKATKKDQKAVIEMYLESLKNTSSELKQEIESSDVLSEINRNIDFMTDVLEGKIKPVDKDGVVITKEVLDERVKQKAAELQNELDKKRAEENEI